MVNVGIKVVFLLLLIVAVPFSNIERHQSWAFESRQLSLPKSKRMLSYLQSKRQSPTDHDCKTIGRNGNDDDPNNDLQDLIISKPTTKRRKILLSSAAAFITTIIASSGTPKVAEASSLAGLEDTEKRRIEVFQRNAPSVVYIDVIAERQDVFSPNAVDERIGTGSGFVWDKDGHIVTNFHVVRNSKFAQVALITPRRNSNNKIIPDDNGPLSVSSSTSSQDVFLPVRTSSTNKVSTDDYKRTVFKARIIGVDPGKDIAVLKIDAPEEILYPIQVGKSLGLIVGQTALAIGNPFGLDHTLTSGVISGLGREVKSPIGRPITNVIQVRQKFIPVIFSCDPFTCFLCFTTSSISATLSLN
jgi:S1-C subfamily serine protease